MQNQARSTNLDLAIEPLIAIDVLATLGIVYCVTSSFPHTTTRIHEKIRAYIRGDSKEYAPHGANTFTLMCIRHMLE